MPTPSHWRSPSESAATLHWPAFGLELLALRSVVLDPILYSNRSGRDGGRLALTPSLTGTAAGKESCSEVVGCGPAEARAPPFLPSWGSRRGSGDHCWLLDLPGEACRRLTSAVRLSGFQLSSEAGIRSLTRGKLLDTTGGHVFRSVLCSAVGQGLRAPRHNSTIVSFM